MLGDNVFFRRGNVISPLGPVQFDYSLSPAQARQALRSLGGWLIQWGDGFVERPTEWYAVICDRFQDLTQTPSKHRCEIRRGLGQCEVRRVDSEYFGRHAYDVYAKAPRRYRGRTPALRSEQEFRRDVGASSKFEDIIHRWVASCEGRVVAYAVVCAFGKIQATYTQVKLHPDYAKAYPVYALIYEMNRHYLVEQGFGYAYDGHRCTGHDTHFQEFLIKKFGFRQAFSHLYMVYRRDVGMLVKAAYPLGRLLGRLGGRVEQFYVLEGIRRSCQRESPQAAP
jgi:hypothetical protein